MNLSPTQQKPIEITKLHPPGVREAILRMRERDIQSYLDGHGLLKEGLSVRRACPICEKDDVKTLFVKEGFSFVQCLGCGLVYVNPRLTEEAVAALYRDGRFAYSLKNLYLPTAEYRKKRFFSERMEYIERYFPQKGAILDVGSSTGHFLLEAQERGWKAYGVELNAFIADYSKSALGLTHIFTGALEEAKFPSGHFEAVTMWDLLEHLPEPLSVLREVVRVLKRGGMLFVYVPNLDSAEVALCGERCENFAGDVHLTYFTPKTLSRLLEKVGLEVVFTETHGLDVDHVIFNLKNFYPEKPYDTAFLEDRKEVLQEMFNRARLGNNLRVFSRKP